MKGIIFVPSVEETNWVRDILPDSSPAELPVAGRRYIDYAIEYAHKSGYRMIEILDWHFSEKLAADFEELTTYTLPVFYEKGNGEMPKSVEDLSKQSSPLTQNINEKITVVWGLLMPGMEIRNVSDWHALNMQILEKASIDNDSFTLPGYSAEGGVYLGSNVVMEHGMEVQKPVLIQDNVWCSRNVKLDGLCVIGKGAFIDEGTHLQRTVVCDNTYVGEGLELVDKIIIGPRIIDAKTGVWTDVEENGISSFIEEKKGILGTIMDFIRGIRRRRMP